MIHLELREYQVKALGQSWDREVKHHVKHSSEEQPVKEFNIEPGF